MASHLNGLTRVEKRRLVHVLGPKEAVIDWPADWSRSLATLLSTGTTGNKIKLVLAPCLAQLGIKVPFLQLFLFLCFDFCGFFFFFSSLFSFSLTLLLLSS